MLEAIILAGGFGTRLKEVVPDLPKPMAPINGKPFLAYLLDGLAKKGFKRVILSVGYMAEKIINYFGCQYEGIELVYSLETEPLGTGGATKLALERCTQDHIYVLNGDTYLDFEVDEIESLWHKNHQPIIVGVEVEDVSRYGRLGLNNDSVISFVEKGIAGKGFINAGCYVFKLNQLENNITNPPFSLEIDFLAEEVGKQSFNFFASKEFFLDIGMPDDYIKAKKELRNQTN
jgi:D-glycero-alpha-D-manno-heptose 1-phosphate guanylyltransferase